MKARMRSWLRRAYLALLGLSTYAQRRKILQRFHVERGLVGGTHFCECTHPSILHFSVNKSASQYVKKILRRCAEENGMAVARMDGYAFHSDFPYLHTLGVSEMAQYQHIFRPRGYLYTAFGGMVEGIPDLATYRIVLMVRDPRDVLTSRFYSVAYSHPVPLVPTKRSAFWNERNQARKMGIDRYVLMEVEQVQRTYERYRRLLPLTPNVHWTKYEEMIADFESWLAKLLIHCGLDVSPKLREELVVEACNSRPDNEEPKSHLRQVTPGDHRRKLQAGTITRLNHILEPELAWFGYS